MLSSFGLIDVALVVVALLIMLGVAALFAWVIARVVRRR